MLMENTQPNPQTEPKTNWQFKGADTAQSNQETPQPKQPLGESISWTASEYVAHDKNSMWYMKFAGLSILVIGITFLITRDFISLLVLVVLAIGIAVFAARKPETLNYQIDNQGVHIGPKLYPISMFKSFAVVEEEAIKSIALLPMKRFMPAITMYFSPEDEKKIEDTLGAMLPQETRQQDPVDRLMHKIRF